MMNYKKLNNYLGWGVFLIAAIVYLITMEKTTSLWDCGEYITTANKLEVGHPPGAPFFMMLGRLFSAFVSPENAAASINAMSALSSAFTILFLFWTITMLGRKIALSKGGSITRENTVAIFGSGLIGALAYTFTDSFWFSAVEGEVYAMSSFFTALVVWAIFKWEVELDQHEKGEIVDGKLPNPNRWLIFIAYMIGLSTGVHLLNLLAIPTIGFVVYFRLYKPDLKGILLAGIISLVTLVFIQEILIPQIPNIGAWFDRIFTNSMGLPFNTGFIFFSLFLGGLLTYAIYYTSTKKKFLFNNVYVALTVIIIGLTSFAMIVVRSNANPPLDENNPESLPLLYSYLKRDQYGSWPILYGPHWNTPSTFGGCEPENYEDPKTSFMKVYSAKVNATNIVTDPVTAQKIKLIVAPLYLKLETKEVKGQIRVSTPLYPDFVLVDGEYVAPNSANMAEFGDQVYYEVTFMNMFEFDEYMKKVEAVNKELADNGLKFKIDIDNKAVSKYVNTFAGKKGERKHLSSYEVMCTDGEVRNVDYGTIFPRMYRTDQGENYMAWINYLENDHVIPLPADGQLAQYGVPGGNKYEQYKALLEQQPEIAQQMYAEGLFKPTMGENITFLFNYQIGYMYMRYFFWNFVGRQNDIQGYGQNNGGKQLLEGNWLSGVDFIDQERLGSQENLPAFTAENTGYNTYFFLPLILGLIGFIFHVIRAPKDWFTILLLFLMTGLAIVIYLNQKPMEPRERDYAYAASFYAFAIWIGLGVYALYEAMKNFKWTNIGIIAAYSFGIGVAVFLIESMQERDHSFSYSLLFMAAIGVGIYTAMGVLGNASKNGVLTAGVATMLSLSIPIILAVQNWDDHNRDNRTTARDFAYNYLVSCDKQEAGKKGSILFTNGDNDTFPLWYIQEVEGVRTDVRVANMSLLGTDWHINQMKRKAYESEPLEIMMPEFAFRNGIRDYVIIKEDEADAGKFISASEAVAFILDDNNRSDGFSTCQLESFLNVKGIYIKVDKKAAVDNGIVTPAEAAQMVDTIKWTLSGGVIYKSDLAVLDLLANYKWDRSIYFASLHGLQANSGLKNYLSAEGLAFKLVPINYGQNGGVNIEKNYELFMDPEKGFKWGNMKTKGVLVDYYTLRMVYNMRATAMKFTDELIQAGKNDMAIAVLDKVFEEMPIENSQVMADDICYYLCANYYDAGAADKGDAMAVKLAQIKLDEISYYQSQSDRFFESMHSEWGRALNMLEMLRQSSREEAQGSRAALNMQLQALQQEYQLKMEGLNEQVKTGQLDMTAATEMQKTYEGEFEAKQTSLYDSYFNQLADASKTYFNVMGPLEKTNYIDVITKSKEVYIKNRNNTKVRAIFEDPQYFPQDYLVIWDL
jgi:MFS family permease